MIKEKLVNNQNYKYKWKYKDNERPKGVCYDCGLKYGEDFPDFIIPDELWELINPTYHEGAGLLCPTCIANRLRHIGKWYVFINNAEKLYIANDCNGNKIFVGDKIKYANKLIFEVSWDPENCKIKLVNLTNNIQSIGFNTVSEFISKCELIRREDKYD